MSEELKIEVRKTPRERMAESEREIAEIERDNATVSDWGSVTGISLRVIDKRSELSRLRSEETKALSEMAPGDYKDYFE